MEKLTYKERVKKLLGDAEKNLPLSSAEIIFERLAKDEDPINPPTGPVANKQSLASDYKMAATLLKASKHCGQTFFAHFFELQLRLLKQVFYLKHKEELDGEQHCQIDAGSAMEIIKVFKWAGTDTEPSTSLSESPPNAPGAVKSGSHSVPNARETNTNTCSTETSTSTTTEGTKNRPKVVSSAVPAKSSKAKQPSHYKVRICPLCHKKQTNLSRHLSTHVNKGEISKCQIQALVQVADKGDETHRQEHFKTKAEKIVRYRRRMYRCPLCEFVTAFLTTHLTRKHKIKRASEDMVKIQKMARTYEGKEELDYIKRQKPSKQQMPAKKSRVEQQENQSLADFLLHGEITEERDSGAQEEESDDLSFHQTRPLLVAIVAHTNLKKAECLLNSCLQHQYVGLSHCDNELRRPQEGISLTQLKKT